MAPTKDVQAVDADEKTLMLKEALKCVDGNLDFEKLAKKLGVTNGEAMRKRFKRFFEKDDEPIQLKGSTLGGSEEGATVPKTPRTPKPKATPATGKKRKSADTASGEDENGTNEDTATKESPLKKPRAPRTPKPPKSPKVSKTPRTLKSSLKVTAAANQGESDDELNSSETMEGAESKSKKKSRIGSPEVQAKADAAIKEAELANGSQMGEAAKQAKRDAIDLEYKNGEA